MSHWAIDNNVTYRQRVMSVMRRRKKREEKLHNLVLGIQLFLSRTTHPSIFMMQSVTILEVNRELTRASKHSAPGGVDNVSMKYTTNGTYNI